MEGVLGELEVWRKTFEIDGEEGEKEAVWKGNWVEWQRERRERATMDNGAKEKSASARSMRGTRELMEVKES